MRLARDEIRVLAVSIVVGERAGRLGELSTCRVQPEESSWRGVRLSAWRIRQGRWCMNVRTNILGAASCGLLALAAPAQHVVTFDQGAQGWSVSGRATVVGSGGNPGANLSNRVLEVFGAEIRTSTNAAFVGDLTRYGSPLVLSADVKINSITVTGLEVSRDLVVEIVDYVTGPYPSNSVWLRLGTLSASQPGWRRFTATIANPLQTTLPAGWGGTGDEDPRTFEPRLPLNRTFVSVLRNAEELRFTTLVPGWFYAFTDFDIQVDNISIGNAAPGAACPPASCGADYNADGGVDGSDLEAFFREWADSAGCSDVNQDGGVDGSDVESFIIAWERGGC